MTVNQFVNYCSLFDVGIIETSNMINETKSNSSSVVSLIVSKDNRSKFSANRILLDTGTPSSFGTLHLGMHSIKTFHCLKTNSVNRQNKTINRQLLF